MPERQLAGLLGQQEERSLVAHPKSQISFTDEIAIPVGHCASCDRSVVTHRTLDDAGTLTTRCLDCDAPVTAETVWSADAAHKNGYAVEGYNPDAESGCKGGRCGSCSP